MKQLKCCSSALPIEIIGIAIIAFFVLLGDKALAQQACVPTSPNLVSWWNGDSVFGRTAIDIQSGNNGRLLYGVTIVPGKVGNAFSFDGIDGGGIRVDSNTGGLLFGSGPFTIDAWIKDTSAVKNRMIIGRSGPTFPFPAWGLRIVADDRLSFFASDCSTGRCGFKPGEIVNSVTPVADGKYHHVAGTRKPNGTLEVYVDGALEGSLSLPPENVDSSSPLAIGAFTFIATGDQLFFGEIDELEFHNRALTTGEIKAIYDAGTAGKCKDGFRSPIALR